MLTASQTTTPTPLKEPGTAPTLPPLPKPAKPSQPEPTQIPQRKPAQGPDPDTQLPLVNPSCPLRGV